jgi:hypothetical protein
MTHQPHDSVDVGAAIDHVYGVVDTPENGRDNYEFDDDSVQESQ